ncbi:hypothetical protein CCR75_003889 [Bremia lactucae]|uniref:Uncharacterized protein n=1 Tax=Bremia lactucae TaxID=4779 RepID=A0A976IIV7_BRELC|nr:hypothetical protein CCR75_003889 [Bremia lactucae]
MANVGGGRVLVGEDSEEDDDDEEEMNFHLDGFGLQSSSVAPRFALQADGPHSAAVGGKVDERSNEEEKAVLLKEEVEKEIKEHGEEQKDEEQTKNTIGQSPESKLTSTKVAGLNDSNNLWQIDQSINGIEIMSNAFVKTVQPSLDATIYRIADLKESQQQLLEMLIEQNNGLRSKRQLEDAAVVLQKLPLYIKKVQKIKAAMQEISVSSEKMKRRVEGLRIDAQSYAIKKENERDKQSQWNKLYAAKNTGASSR